MSADRLTDMSSAPENPRTEPVPNLNIANVLTVARLLLVPLLVWVLWNPQGAAAWWWGLVIFGVAVLTVGRKPARA